MFKKFFILCLLLNITFINVYSQLKKLTAPNLRTEAEIFTDNQGNWYSNTLRVHFAQKTIDLESRKSFASIFDILQPEVKKMSFIN